MPYGYTPLTALDAMAECFELPLLAAATAVALAVSPCARRHPPAHGLHTTGWEALTCPGFTWMSVDHKVLRAPHPQLQYAWRGGGTTLEPIGTSQEYGCAPREVQCAAAAWVLRR